MTTRRRGPLIAGAVLIIIGVAFLVGRQAALQVDWLSWPIVVGIAIIAIAIVVGGNAAGFAALGGILTMLGVVLAVQRETGATASWVYAWALVAPAGVGLGLMIYGLFTRQWEHVRGGFTAFVVGIALFLVFYLFFAGTLGTGVLDPDVATTVVPAAILGLGVLLVAAAFISPLIGGRTSRDAEWAPAGASANPAGSSPGPFPAGAAAGAAAGESVAAGDPDGGEPYRAIELGSATAADIGIAFGAGLLSITGPSRPGTLVDGTLRGGVRREELGPGRVKLATPTDRIWDLPWDRAPFDWRIGVTAEVPVRLSLESGAAKVQADLTEIKVTDLRVRVGAADSTIILPRGAGRTHVDAQGGAAALRFIVPAGVAVSIRSQVALGSTDIDEARFPRDAGGGWSSPDFAAAANRVQLMLQGGLGTISVR